MQLVLSRFLGGNYNYNLSKKRFTWMIVKLQAQVLHRLARVSVSRMPKRAKIFAIRAFVLSMMSGNGAWHALPSTATDKRRKAIEKTVLVGVNARSRFLLWACHFGPCIDPEFVIEYAVIRHELWKLSDRAQVLRATVVQAARLQEVLVTWQWQLVSPRVFCTRLSI